MIRYNAILLITHWENVLNTANFPSVSNEFLSFQLDLKSVLNTDVSLGSHVHMCIFAWQMQKWWVILLLTKTVCVEVSLISDQKYSQPPGDGSGCSQEEKAHFVNSADAHTDRRSQTNRDFTIKKTYLYTPG